MLSIESFKIPERVVSLLMTPGHIDFVVPLCIISHALTLKGSEHSKLGWGGGWEGSVRSARPERKESQL